jgi:uncharacterized protein YdiU (UPF0061 family)
MSHLHQLGFSNRSNWEIHLKGAGKPLYARLAELNFPATRSLCVIAGDEMVYRQDFKPAAILVRQAPSHIRFGAFVNYGFQRNTEALLQQYT